VSRDNAVSLCLAQALLRTGVAGFSDFEPSGARIVGALLKIISDRPGPDLDGASAQVVLMYGAKGHSDTDASAGVYASPVANILAAMPTLSDVRALQQTLWSGITMACKDRARLQCTYVFTTFLHLVFARYATLQILLGFNDNAYYSSDPIPPLCLEPYLYVYHFDRCTRSAKSIKFHIDSSFTHLFEPRSPFRIGPAAFAPEFFGHIVMQLQHTHNFFHTNHNSAKPT
jgi:hypothetical protein